MPPKPVVTRQDPAPVKKTVKKVATGSADSEDPWERAGTETIEREFLKMLLFGGSGTGKTRTASSFPGPILWIICSGIQKSGELISIEHKYRPRITPLTLRNTGEALTMANRQRETGKYKTVVLDHASGLQDYSMREILGIPQMPAQLTFGVAAREQWNESNGQVKEILRALLGLDNHVVIIAQERDFSDKWEMGAGDALAPAIGAALTPGVASWLAPTCDYVCQTYKRAETKIVTQTIGEGEDATPVEMEERTGKYQYCARIGPHDQIMTKFRSPENKLPDYIVDPSFDKFMKLINGGK